MNTQEQTLFGSYDPENTPQEWQREEFEKMEKLLKENTCTIEKMSVDKICFFRAVVARIMSSIKRWEIKQWVTSLETNDFLAYETDINEMLAEQLMNRALV